MRTLLVIAIVTMPTVGLAAQERSSLHPPIPLLDGAGQNVLESHRPVSTMKTCAGCHDTAYIEEHSFHVELGHDERTAVGFVDGGRPWDYSPSAFGRWDPLDYRYLTPPGDERLDLGVADWVRVSGTRHVGGGPSRVGHAGLPLDRPSISSSDELNPDALVLDAATGGPRSWDWQASGTVEMNCFLCHTDRPDNKARIEELAAGRFAWSGTATLAATGIVKRANDGWQFVRDHFDQRGTVDAGVLGLGDPKPQNCGLCHGQVHMSHEAMKLDMSLSTRSTATTGRVFSGQRISDSAVNLADKEEMGRPWDVHAERLVGCTDCHFSMNNPAFATSSMVGGPGHMDFDPRRSSVGEYLVRPSHQFAKGTTAQGSTARHLGGTMRRCNDCHHAEASHNWLPYQAVHFAALSCEACHIPHAAAPAVESIDWTFPSPDGQPTVTWRGIRGALDDPGALVTGFQPLLMPRREPDGKTRLVPCNLITATYWVENGPVPRPVRLHDLTQVVASGATGPDAVRAGLVERGYSNVEIRTEVQPFEMHHGVVGGRWATRSCDACHSADSILSDPMTLAAKMAGDSSPQWAQKGSLATSGTWTEIGDRPAYRPSTSAAGYYVLGHDGHRWIDALGILMLLGVLLGASVHGGLRIRHAWARRIASKAKTAPTEGEPS